MDDEDLFIDNERIQKMIAAGIYDESMANKLKTIKNKDLKDSAERSMIRPAEERTPIRQLGRQGLPFQSQSSRGRGRGMSRGRGDRGRGMSRGRGDRGRGRSRDGPLAQNRVFRDFQSITAHQWQEVAENDTQEEEDFQYPKRSRGLSPRRDTFREPFIEGIRDGIQNQIQRNELQRKVNDDYINDMNAGNSSSNDMDLRPISDTDSRIRDTDLRAATNPINDRKTAPNLSNITSTANAEDYRHGGGDRGAARGSRDSSFAKQEVERRFFDLKAAQRSGPSNSNKHILIDDLDDFIKQTANKLDLKPSELEPNRDRGQSSQRSVREDCYDSNDPLGLNQPGQLFHQRSPEDDNNFEDSPNVLEVAEESDQNPIEILKETVEELAKSNLYCQYCDCYLSSLVEVNTHIGTVIHNQNMTKKIMEENNKSKATGPSNSINSSPMNRPISQTIIERVPTGMAIIVHMIERKQKITLKSLTEMDNYEISCDNEAALAKELAKLLTNELLNYKMNLMPDTVKEALKHQGIGLLNSMVTN